MIMVYQMTMKTKYSQENLLNKRNIMKITFLGHEYKPEYIPYVFVKTINLKEWTGIDEDDFWNCRKGPRYEKYWKSWENILKNAKNNLNQDLHINEENGCLELWDEDEDPNQEYDQWGDEIFREEYKGQ